MQCYTDAAGKSREAKTISLRIVDKLVFEDGGHIVFNLIDENKNCYYCDRSIFNKVILNQITTFEVSWLDENNLTWIMPKSPY